MSFVAYICREGLLTHSFFPERDWSGVWLRLNARRLAVPRCSQKSRLFGGKKNPEGNVNP